MLAVELFVGARLLDGKLAGLLVIGAIGLERARTALVKLVDGGAQILLKLLLVKGVGEHGQVDVLIKIDFVGGSGCFGLATKRLYETDRPHKGFVMANDLFCGSFAVDDGLIGLGLIGPAKVIACHGELIVLPCRVDLGGGRRSVGERDVDTGNGGVGVG